MSLIKSKISQAFLLLKIQEIPFDVDDICNQFKGEGIKREVTLLEANEKHNIIIKRHFRPNKCKTHITTSLNAHELEKRYENSVRSRIRAMFNLISFDEN